MKAISLLMSLMLIISSFSGCATVKITGKPFYEEGSAEELIVYLDQGIGILTKGEVKAKIGGQPEIFSDSEKERWIYKYSKLKERSTTFIVYTKYRNEKLDKELELIFDKNGILKSYRIDHRSSESNEKVDKVKSYSDRLTDGLIAGVIGAVVLLVIELLKDKIKEKAT